METSRTMRAKTKYNDFSGGIQVYTSPLWTRDSESPFCKNIDLSRPGILGKALGYSELGSVAGEDVSKGAFVFNSEDGSSIVYKVAGDMLSKYDNGWSNVGAVSGADKVESALMYIDPGSGIDGSFEERVYFSVGLDSALRYTDGVSVGAVADVYSKHIETYKSRIYLGNVKQGVDSYPSRIIYSDISSDDFQPESYIDAFGEPITALKEYSGSLFVFSEDKLAAYDEYKLQTIPGNFGTTSASTVQGVKGRMLWYNRSGVFIYAGSEIPQIVSKGISKWIEAIVDPREVTAGIDSEERYNLYIGDVVVDGESFENVVLRYDISLNAWDILLDRPFKYWVRQRAGGVYKVYATDTASSKVWQVGEGNSLNGGEIESEWISSKLDVGQPDTIKNFYEAYITFKPSGEDEYLSLEYRLNGEKEWKQIGATLENVSLSGEDDIETVRLVLPPNTQGKMIQFKLGHTSSDYGFNIYELMIKADEFRS